MRLLVGILQLLAATVLAYCAAIVLVCVAAVLIAPALCYGVFVLIIKPAWEKFMQGRAFLLLALPMLPIWIATASAGV